MMKLLSFLKSSWRPGEWVVLGYMLASAVYVLIGIHVIDPWFSLLAFRLLVLSLMIGLPVVARRYGWRPIQNPASSGLGAWRDSVAGFLRHAYPLLLVLFFFEEIAYTVNVLYPQSPYWFEPLLYDADRFIFGTLPVHAMAALDSILLSEVMHAFYFSYYCILIAGLVLEWRSRRGKIATAGRETEIVPDAGVTGMSAAYFLTFLLFPILPARGPWENPEIMQGLDPFQGYVFTPLIHFIIDHGAVSGGCFPSSHVAGTWGLVLGLAAERRRAAAFLGILAAGMTFSCVFTRYHHGVDALAGMIMGFVGGLTGHYLRGGKNTKVTLQAHS